MQLTSILTLTLLLVAYAMYRSSSTGVLLQVADHQVAMVLDNRTGEVRTDDTPGYKTVLPWLQQAYRLEKSPVEYVMTGNDWIDDNHVPRLIVRASDGSSFWFHQVTIQYAIRPDLAWTVVGDAGTEYEWRKQMMDAFARSILRDEYGRHTAEEIVNADSLRAATARAQERLNQALESHGLIALELVTSKPAFSAEYESVVQRRKVADQEIGSFDQGLEQLSASRAARLAKVERDKQLELTTMRGDQARKLAKAERDAIRKRAEADRYLAQRVGAGEQLRDQLLSQADASAEQFTKEAEGFRERADALAEEGVLAVRKALIDNLSRIEFEIAPFAQETELARQPRFSRTE